MKFVASLLLMFVGLAYLAIAHADPSAVQAVGTAAVNAAVDAAVKTAVQQPSTQLLLSGGFWAAVSTIYGAVSLISSGLQQIFGLGAKSSNKTVASVSSGAIASLQHLSGAPDVSSPK